MSVYSAKGIRRNRSPMTAHRHDLLPFGLDADAPEASVNPANRADFSRENLAPLVFRLFTVRLCPRARRRIRQLLELPHLHPEVRQIYCGLLAWATD